MFLLPGVLKSKGRDIFHPQLPDTKLDAIENIGFGTVDKIYLEFQNPTLNANISWSFLYKDDGISYSSEDATNDWTRFLLGSYVIDSRLTTLWLSGANTVKFWSKIIHFRFENILLVPKITKKG